MSTASAYRYDASALREVFEHRFTYVAGIERNSHRFARHGALRDPASGRRWTYAELWRDAGRLAGALRSHGVAPGESVVYALFNGAEFALLWVACLRLGAIATPINFRLSAGEIAHVLDDSRPRAFVFDQTLERTAADALTRAEHQPSLLAAAGEATAPAFSFEELLASGDAGAEVHPPDGSTIYDETTRLYTSGTTGMPKGVSLCSLTETLSAHDVIMHFPLEPQDRTLNMTPWFHRGGLYSGGPNPVFYVGAESVALRQFDPATVLDWVQSEGLTFLIGAPTNLAMLTAEQQRSPRDLASLKGIVTMGAPLDREACLRYQDTLTARIFNGYGTTEAFWNTFLRPGDLPEHAGSAGRACTDDDVAVVRIYEDRLADPGDTVAKDGSEVGEVAVRSVKSGYAYVNNAGEQAERFHDGWLFIGDLASWDEDEYVTIVGRKDDMIISGGENVHPTQVEAVLTEHPGVQDAAVVGLPDERWGEIVVAYVVASDPSLDAAALEAHCKDHPMLAAFKRPRLYRFVDELPMTATGKKVHYQVREMAQRDSAEGLLLAP
ncbi:MAG TPA: AMP-binding protein [Solirubrobacteraceae bacterium]|nr:AMP-binding protein [Solirubrobacteraceae bacterium]